MDQELIAFFNDHFRETSRQIESVRQETTQQIASLRDETAQRLDQIDGRLDQIEGRFERLEDRVHQTQILVEGLRDDMRLLADGVVSIGERLEVFQSQMATELKGISLRVAVLEAYVANQGRDSMEIIRARYGSKPL